MPTLTITKSYDDNTVLTEDQLDDIKDSIETFVNTTKLGADNLQDSSVGTDQLASTSVTTAKLGNNAVTASKLSSSASVDADRAVGTDHLKDASVTTAKLGALAVDTANIAANAVTTAKIADNNITQAKLANRDSGGTAAAVGEIGIASSSGSSVTSSTSYINVTNQSVSITTSGRPIMMFLQPSGGADSYLYSNGFDMGIRIQRDGNTVYETTLFTDAGAEVFLPPGCVQFLELGLASGTYTYVLQIKNASGGVSVGCFNLALVVYEI